LIDGVDYADVMLIGDGKFRSIAPTAPVLVDLDEVQMRYNEGPCVSRKAGRRRWGFFDGRVNRGQFLWVPSCSMVRAFSTLSVPEAWLGGYAANVARNSPTMVMAGTMVQSFSPHHRP
jgi:hypothetical protein